MEYRMLAARGRRAALKPVPAIISVHDVMPDTLALVDELLTGLLQRVAPTMVTLLVVPGLDWQPPQVAQLERWQVQGYELAGHGWRHRVCHQRNLYHRLHGLLLSRDAAEHLSLAREELVDLVSDSYCWFAERRLALPRLYVPPAWTLGVLQRSDLQALPYRYYETIGGCYDSELDRFRHLPLVGFEADRWWRVPFLRLWNTSNLLAAGVDRPLRLAIHPRDHRLALAGQLQHWLEWLQPASPV